MGIDDFDVYSNRLLAINRFVVPDPMRIIPNAAQNSTRSNKKKPKIQKVDAQRNAVITRLTGQFIIYHIFSHNIFSLALGRSQCAHTDEWHLLLISFGNENKRAHTNTNYAKHSAVTVCFVYNANVNECYAECSDFKNTWNRLLKRDCVCVCL